MFFRCWQGDQPQPLPSIPAEIGVPGTPRAGWFFLGKIQAINMDDDLGVPGSPILGNPHFYRVVCEGGVPPI